MSQTGPSLSYPAVLLKTRFVLALAFVLCFAIVSSASAVTVTMWTGAQPAGNAGASVPVIISGSGANDGYPLVPSSARLYVDGASIPSFTDSINPASVYFSYAPDPALTDGSHTFRVEVSDSSPVPVLSSYEWTANIVQPPSAVWVAPVPGSTAYEGRPTIVMSLSDNTPGTTFAVTGQIRSGSGTGPVVEWFGGSGLAAGSASFVLPTELLPGTYYRTATVQDGAGNTLTMPVSSFTVATAPVMTVLTDCDGCHPTYRNAHPAPSTTDCLVCHRGYDTVAHEGDPYCDDCHFAGSSWAPAGHGTTVAVTSQCASCHNPTRLAIPRHSYATVDASHTGGCGGCHGGSIVAPHAITPEDSAYPNQCDLCHGSIRADVRTAIATHDTGCDACHSGHPADTHDSVAMPECSTCHGSDVTAIHTGPCGTCHAPDAPPGATCVTCHPDRTARHGSNGGSRATLGDGYVSWEIASNVASTSPDQSGGPHGRYSVTTVKCAVCHAVHGAPRESFVLTKVTTANATNVGHVCAYCHGYGSTVGARIVAINQAPLSNAPHSTICFEGCHAGVHGVHASKYPVLAAKLLRDTADTMIAAAIADPNTGMTGDMFSALPSASTTFSVTQFSMAAGYICGQPGCHTQSAFAIAKRGDAMNVQGRGGVAVTLSGHPVVADAAADFVAPVGSGLNPAGGSTGISVAFKPTNGCDTCHDLSDPATTEGKAFPHNAGGSRLWMMKAGSAAGSDATTVTDDDRPGIALPDAYTTVQDGVCLKCHRLDDAGTAGVGSTF